MLFSKLPEAAFDHLLQPVDHFLFPPGATLYNADSQKKHIYSIRRGMVKLVRVLEDGTHRIVRLLGPGAAIGLELLDGADGYHHTAIAVNQVDLCKLPVPTVKQLETEYPEICHRVRDQLQAQLDLADQWIVALGTGSAKQRAAQLILVMEKHFSDDKGAFLLLSREDMSAMTGIAAETISRTIAEFKRQDILSKTQGNLYLCNSEKLEDVISQE
ncbi:MAG: Crp/Fnr family transcriptional regulator [Gammaproteobacteria bacterium]